MESINPIILLSQIKKNTGKARVGYLYNGHFYSDSQHTTQITPIQNCMYINQYDGTLYYYNGTSFSSLGGGSGLDVVVAWNGQAAPNVSLLPAGVTVTHSGTNYTGTLTASSSTTGKLYFVYMTNGSSPNIYKEYMTVGESGSYSWEMMGTTEVSLTNYYNKSEVDTLLSAKVSDVKVGGTSVVSNGVASITLPTVVRMQ